MVQNDNATGTYDAFGIFGTLFREIGWKTPMVLMESGPENSLTSASQVARPPLQQLFAFDRVEALAPGQ